MVRGSLKLSHPSTSRHGEAFTSSSRWWKAFECWKLLRLLL